MNYNKSLKIKRAGGSMTPAKSAVPQRAGKGLIGKRRRKPPVPKDGKRPTTYATNPGRRRRRFKLPQGHGRPTPGPRSPKTPFKGVQRDPRRGPRRDGGFRRRRIRNRFTRK